MLWEKLFRVAISMSTVLVEKSNANQFVAINKTRAVRGKNLSFRKTFYDD